MNHQFLTQLENVRCCCEMSRDVSSDLLQAGKDACLLFMIDFLPLNCPRWHQLELGKPWVLEVHGKFLSWGSLANVFLENSVSQQLACGIRTIFTHSHPNPN